MRSGDNPRSASLAPNSIIVICGLYLVSAAGNRDKPLLRVSPDILALTTRYSWFDSINRFSNNFTQPCLGSIP